jgi:GT2 family glycosyltransferase/hemerythrin superfamily protein
VTEGDEPRVSVVMITMDRPEQAAASLAKLRSLPERPPIVVINNGAASRAFDGPRTVVLEPGENLGAAGRNLGVAHVDTPYVAFSDDDSWWAPGALRRAAATLDRFPGVGLLAARVVVEPGGRVDEFSRELARSPLPGDRAPGVPILGFMACAAVLRVCAFRETGGFDRRLGVGGEEEPLAWDLAEAGWGLHYDDRLVAHHHPALGRDVSSRQRHQLRNAVWVAWERLPARDAARATAASLRRARPLRSAALGLVDALRGLPAVHQRRRVVPPDVASAKRLLLRHQHDHKGLVPSPSGRSPSGADPEQPEEPAMSQTTKVDVVAFLKSQHDEIEGLIAAVKTGTGEQQKDAFQCLVRLLAVHETAEEEVVHPLAKREPGGASIVEQRLGEEAEAKEALHALEQLEVGSADFMHKFDEVAKSVKEHAEKEEHEEFPIIAANEDETALQRFTKMVEMAEKTAPTHPHPHAPESALGNLVVGPFAAIADRTRDALRSG